MDSRYHQWCSIKLRENLWFLEKPNVDFSGLTCPLPEDVHATGRFKSATYIERRRQRIINQTPELTEIEKEQIKQIYEERSRLNNDAGYILFHVDHKVPLSKGGLHHPSNLAILKASENIMKGARLMPR
ncbi:HNH endonuclease signature motif containing protein [Synechococcus lacustris]|uniref:HNH endonuclease signature motif containing protein n=1 Tax=Synechococcus lacustris TaxID=2116544 RepID=UPI0020CDAEF0|nr:HNH endonuclease signature motif containing protein [Synechococcus lacustris]MCP9813987.1 HNH endonuclease [Synechococcus lacustris L1E-Slac]